MIINTVLDLYRAIFRKILSIKIFIQRQMTYIIIIIHKNENEFHKIRYFVSIKSQ